MFVPLAFIVLQSPSSFHLSDHPPWQESAHVAGNSDLLLSPLCTESRGMASRSRFGLSHATRRDATSYGSHSQVCWRLCAGNLTSNAVLTRNACVRGAVTLKTRGTRLANNLGCPHPRSDGKVCNPATTMGSCALALPAFSLRYFVCFKTFHGLPGGDPGAHPLHGACTGPTSR